MAEITRLFAEMGIAALSYLKSGNFVLRGSEAALSEEKIAEELRRALALSTTVFLRTPNEYQELIAASPYRVLATDAPQRTMITFFHRAPSAEARALLAEMLAASEYAYVGTRELYSYIPEEVGARTFSNSRLEKVIGTAVTTRGWNTIMQIKRMADMFFRDLS